MDGMTPQQKKRKTEGQLDRDAARILDVFYAKLKRWAIQRRRPCVTLPTWNDIRAARVLVRMQTLSKEELYDKMDTYFNNLDALLEQQPTMPTFTHFLNSIRNIVGG